MAVTCALVGCDESFQPVTCQKYCTPEHRRMARRCSDCRTPLAVARDCRYCAECMCRRERVRRDDANYRRSQVARLRLKQYGLTAEQYAAMLEAQNHRCAICREPETAQRNGQTKMLGVDHNHATGAVRGLLCLRCNTALGLLLDDTARLRAALAYLESWS